jgi:hypothetical protein
VGTPLEIPIESTTLGEYGLVPPTDRAAEQPIQLSKVSVAVEELLKGNWPGERVTIGILDDASMLPDD